MLVHFALFGGRVSMSRVVISSLIAFIMVTLFLYVRINYSKQEPDGEKSFMNLNFNNYYASENTENEDIYKPLSETEMYSQGEIMDDRIDHMKRVCNFHALERQGSLNAQEYFIDDKDKLVWCSVFKTVSTSWFYNLNLVTGFIESEDEASEKLFNTTRELLPSPSIEQLIEASDNSIAMMIVRHPFERLSLVFRDKFQQNTSNREEKYTILAKEIVQKFRKANQTTLDPLMPTFEEFVEYIVFENAEKRPLNSNWIPYTSFCTPCHYDFDAIVKFETLERDQKYIIQWAGLIDTAKKLWKIPGDEKKPETNNSELVKSHYSQLTEDQIYDLYNVYRFDFLLFDYSPEEYYSMSKNKHMDNFDNYDYSDDYSDY